MKILELFSGIGGMHCALKVGGVQGDVIAVEINPIANDVYRLNFPTSLLMQKNILSLRAEEINSVSPDIILMSPPCQPFTRVGLKKDLDDVRTDPLKYILSLLHDLPSLKYILIENVKGFEDSEARNTLIKCLEELHFIFREFLISPSQMGVPNMRTRYYLIAKRQPLQFSFESSNIFEELPKEGVTILEQLQNQFPTIQSVEDILETNDVCSEIYQDHLLPESLLQTRLQVMDIVTPDDTRTCCFTKAYGSYAKGTGSIFCPFSKTTSLFKRLTEEPLDNNTLRDLKLRYFTPREVARLMSFPEEFTFPPHTTRKQNYRLLGNSLNVKVVAVLIKLMLSEPQGICVTEK